MRIIIALMLAALAAFSTPSIAQQPQHGLNGSRSVINAVVQEPIRSFRAFGKRLNPGATCNLQTRDKVEILGEDATDLTVRKIRRLSRVSMTINFKFWKLIPTTVQRSEICPKGAKVKLPIRYKEPLTKSWDAHAANEQLKSGKKE